MTTIAPPEIYAFWRYDLFPGVLGNVGTMLDNGDVYVPAYSGTFKRKSILAMYPVELGKTIHEEIRAIQHEHETKAAALLQESKAKLIDVMPEMAARYPK